MEKDKIKSLSYVSGMIKHHHSDEKTITAVEKEPRCRQRDKQTL